MDCLVEKKYIKRNWGRKKEKRTKKDNWDRRIKDDGKDQNRIEKPTNWNNKPGNQKSIS